MYKNSVSISEEELNKYLPLVKQIANQIGTKEENGFAYEDLVSIGVLGLMDAFSKYDEKRNNSFENYAKWRIRGNIIDELRKNGRISRGKVKKVKNIYETRNILEQKLMREPTDKEIADEMGIEIHELYEIEENIHYLSLVSLDKVIFSGDEDSFTLMDFIEDNSEYQPDEIVLTKEKRKKLMDAINLLKEREKILLNLYYVEELKLKEIAEIMGVSLSRISQIHGQILIKLKGILNNK